jgi:hypothetical protein
VGVRGAADRRPVAVDLDAEGKYVMRVDLAQDLARVEDEVTRRW